jgi:hypothetical protein
MKRQTKLKPGVHIVGTKSSLLVILLLAVFIFMGFTIGRNVYEKPPSREELFMIQAQDYSNDTSANYIAEQCASLNYSTNSEEAYCVHDFIRSKFNFTNDGHLGIKTPEQTLKTGGVCRDWSIAYAVILLKLNWTIEFVTPPYHVFVTAAKGDVYCNFDQTEFTCYSYSENKATP